MANNVPRPADDPSNNDRRLADTGRAPEGHHSSVSAANSASQIRTETAPDDHSAQEAWIGTDDPRVAQGNVSWGAVFAGVVTFLAVMVLFGVGAAALGLQESSGTVVGIWAVVGLVVAFLVAGYLSGALGVRSGLFHGFVTWATSVLAVIVLTGWLGAGVLGTLGSITGTVAETASGAVDVTSEDAQSATEGTDPEQVQDEAGQLADEAGQTAEEAAPAVAAGSWWTLGGLLVGAVLASLAGVAGARSVVNKRENYVADGNRI